MAAAPSSRLVSALLLAAALVAVSAPVGLALRVVEAGVPDLAVDGDHALIDLATRQAAAGRRVLGPYSRLGFHHPGPALFYVYAPFHTLSGGRYLSLCLAVLVLVASSLLVVLGVFAGRCPARALAAAAAALGLLLLFLSPSVLASPWNPHALLLPLLASLVAFAAVAAGEARWLPAAVVLGSLAVQCHLAVAVPVAVAAAIAALGWAGAPAAARSSLRVPGAVALLLGAVLWAPVAIEAAAGGGGNPAAIWEYLRAPRSSLPLSEAATEVLERFGGPLLTPLGARARDGSGGVAATAGPWPGLLLLTGSGLLCLLLRGPQRRLSRALAAVASASAVATTLAVAAAGTPAEGHAVRWIAVLGIVALLAATAAIPPGRRALSLVEGLLAAALVALAAATWTTVARWDDIDTLLAADATARNRDLGEAAAAACQRARASRASLVVAEPGDWGAAAAVAARLADHGLGFAIDRRWALLFDTAPRPEADDLRLAILRRPLDRPIASAKGLHLERLEPGVPPPFPVSLAEDAALPWLLDGFGTAEGAGEDAFRWSAGDLSRLLLKLPYGTSAAVLALELRPVAGGRRVQSVRVTVDGAPVGESDLDPLDYRWYRFRVAPGPPGRTVEVELRYGWTASPRELGWSVEDPRRLAVRWRRLSLEPAVPLEREQNQPPAPSASAGTPAAASAAATASGARPRTATTLSREVPPATTSSLSLPTPSTEASSPTTARFARPRSGAALTSSLSAPPWAPTRRSWRAPGLTRTLRPDPASRDVTRTASSMVVLSPGTGSRRGESRR